MARIPHRSTHLRRTTRTSERAQLIHDKETDTYLNYRQLLKHPKYKETWSKSAANEFGRLTQGLKDGRVKGKTRLTLSEKNKFQSKEEKMLLTEVLAVNSNQTKRKKNVPDSLQEVTG